jgi:cyclin H
LDQATAIQYLRRFYLSNSPMTYHPKQIMMCALFLATKSDHWHIPLSNFVSKLPNVSEDDVKAPEFLLMQGLRFTLDVRHPMRGLEGGIGEILAMVEDGSLAFKEKDTYAAQRRVGAAADKASNLLRTAAQMTDAYFLYTPAQMWLSALQVADPDLASTYLKEKLNLIGLGGVKMHEKLSEVLTGCAELLASYKSPDDDSTEKEMKRIGKKLHLCQNPEKIDLVAVTKAKAAEKRDSVNGNGADQALKKRKLERKGLQNDDDVYRPHHKT